MNKCAFVIPLHPKHYTYGYYIINELVNTDVDLYFIFTDLEDKQLFRSKLSSNLVLNSLVLTDFTDIEIVQRTNSFVSIKKLYALSVLYTKYDYISCIDSEIHFLKKNNFYTMMESISNAATICGGKVNDNSFYQKILYDTLLRLTEEKYHTELKNISQDFTIYTWWSNTPVYTCKNVNHFLRWIQFSASNLNRFSWHTFDDMLYNYFCVLFYNYKLILIPNCTNSLEFTDSHLLEYVDKNLSKLYWVNKNAYHQNKEYYNTSNFYIVFHLDRN